MISDIQGVRSARRYVLTDPCVHSVNCGSGRPFGGNDLGIMGVELFFSKHICNALCFDLGLPFVAGADAVLRSRRAVKTRNPSGDPSNDNTAGTLLATRRWDGGEGTSGGQRWGRGVGRFSGGYRREKESLRNCATWLDNDIVDGLLADSSNNATMKSCEMGKVSSAVSVAEGGDDTPAAASVDRETGGTDERRQRVMRLFTRRSSLRDVMAAALDREETAGVDERSFGGGQGRSGAVPGVKMEWGQGGRNDVRGEGRGEGRTGRVRENRNSHMPIWRKMFRPVGLGSRRPRGHGENSASLSGPVTTEVTEIYD